MIGFSAVVSILALIVGAIVVRAWVMTVLWSWFLVPAFHVPELAITTAIGLAIIINMFTQHLQDKQPRDKSDVGDALTKAFLSPLVTLALAWIVTWFM